MNLYVAASQKFLSQMVMVVSFFTDQHLSTRLNTSSFSFKSQISFGRTIRQYKSDAMRDSRKTPFPKEPSGSP